MSSASMNQSATNPMVRSVVSTEVRIDVAAALRCYRDESAFVRAFTLGRHLLCPMRAVAREVPATGRVLDVGCGHGLFANLLALGSSRREVTGVDPDPDKLAVARRSGQALPNVRYVQGVAADISDGPYDCITILDVLYLLPDEPAAALLAHCRRLLAPGGVLLLKTNDTRPAWKFFVVRMEEELMVKMLRFTYGGQVHFRSSAHYRDLLRRAGFAAQVSKIDGFRPVPHRLFVCRTA